MATIEEAPSTFRYVADLSDYKYRLLPPMQRIAEILASSGLFGGRLSAAE
jgi:hypothetical protein